MKCVKSNTGEIKRVTNERAEAMVKTGWVYIPKKEWKETVRKVAVTPEPLFFEDTIEKKEPKVKGD